MEPFVNVWNLIWKNNVENKLIMWFFISLNK
jgi:hypothetical protein